jgi:CheY-like chemotaxis protein
MSARLCPIIPPTAHAVPTPFADATPGDAPAKTVLVVDDDDMLRTLMMACLARGGYRVIEAATAAEAVGVWESQGESIDLLLADIVLPGGMTGLELAKRFRATRPELGIVLTSGYTLINLGIELEPLVRENFLPKPFSPQTLIDRVDSLVAARPTTA